VVDGGEFSPELFGPARWLEGESAYATVEPSAQTQGGSDIVRYDAGTGARSLLIPATRLIPSGETRPLRVANYRWSADKQLVLIFTNTARVWRANTRGDYWVLDRRTWSVRKLGGDAKPSTLMFAKFSPDSRSVAYVRENDLYVEPVAGGPIARLTSDGPRTTINGTTDWVYEEELALRDAFRWSRDSKQIAYWQFDVRGVRDFLLINDTDSLYSFTVPVQYRQGGDHQLGRPRRCRERDGRSNAVVRDRGESARALHRAHGMGCELRRGVDPAAQPRTEHPAGHPRQRENGRHAHDLHRSRQRVGRCRDR
jgi:dipeptidyl-peptidase 4